MGGMTLALHRCVATFWVGGCVTVVVHLTMTSGLEIRVIVMITHIRLLVLGVIFQQWFAAVDLRMGGIPGVAGGEVEYQGRGFCRCATLMFRKHRERCSPDSEPSGNV